MDIEFRYPAPCLLLSTHALYAHPGVSASQAECRGFESLRPLHRPAGARDAHTASGVPGRLSAVRAILQPLIPLTARDAEALPALVDRFDRYQSHQRKITQLATKVNCEKQFNRRVELNQQLNALKAELANLS